MGASHLQNSGDVSMVGRDYKGRGCAESVMCLHKKLEPEGRPHSLL